MKAKDYTLLNRCVSDGVQRGWARAHKHVDNPPEETIRICIEEAVMLECAEAFIFDEVPE